MPYYVFGAMQAKCLPSGVGFLRAQHRGVPHAPSARPRNPTWSAMSSRLAAVRAQGGISLKHFMLRTEARSLYRDVLRAIKGMDESTATSVRQEARERFAQNANETDVEQIKVLLIDGKHSLKEMISLFSTVR